MKQSRVALEESPGRANFMLAKPSPSMLNHDPTTDLSEKP
jgi:hypothetical protein